MKNYQPIKIQKIFFVIVLLLTSGLCLMGQAPTATTGAATGIGSSGATLNGTVNANGLPATVFFEYGLTEEYGQTVAAVPSPVSGSTATPVLANLSLLDPSTTYHFRVVAQNASGTTYGADMTFTTTAPSGPAPAVVTDPATGIGVDFATLNGQVHTFGVSSTVIFQWGTDTNYGNTVTADQSPLTSAALQPVTAALTSLPNNTTYHYRVVASNINGTTYGPDITFVIGSVGSAPTVTTNAATAVGSSTATLNGTVNANGDATTVTFEYGLTTGYGSTALAAPSPVSGSTNTAVSATPAAFLPNTLYHYRVVGANTFGTTTGADMTFTTLPMAPIATTTGASAVGTTTATLNGLVNANNDSTTVTFEYGPTTSYGTTVTAGQSPVTGSTPTAVSKALSGLTNGITYHYRVMAVNAGGTTTGADMTFTTGATAPTATTNAATAVGATTATLNGTVNANNSSTTVTFQYGTSTNYDRSVAAIPGTVTGSSNTSVNAAVSSLTPNMTYHFRVVAVNAGGTTYGADMTFTTGPGPEVTTGAASAVDTTTATLNGLVNANNDSTTVTFEYGLTTAYGTTVTADQSPVSGTTDTAVSTTLLNLLTPSTIYHYRVVGQNSSGTTYGADMTFTTSADESNAPTAITLIASGVGTAGATLRGSVNSKNHSTTITFEYGTTPAYGTTVTADQSPVTFDGAVTVTSTLAGILAPNTTYHYRVKAQNAFGTSYGADMTFYTSAPAAPTATTDAASAVGIDNAVLNGTVNANNAFTIVSFEYGVTVAYGTTTLADQSPVQGVGNTGVTRAITGLATGTTYHYRVKALNGFGTVYGADMTFTTGSTTPTATTDAATAVGATTATLNGTVNANNTTTTVTFEYGLDTNYGLTAIAAQNPVSGSTDTAVSSSLTTLAPNITYHYRVKAQNTSNTVYGADMTFTTGSLPPTADTNAASAVSATGATLNGTVNANNDSTTVTFEYGLTTGYGTTVTADQSPVTGAANTAVSKAITGLTNNTTYYYRVVAQNGSGTTYGADMTFFTGTAPPTVTTAAASGIGSTSATLNGTVNANNSSTTVTFEYGDTTGYGRTVTADQSPVTGSTGTPVSVTPTDLLPNITYHYRAVGQNASGTTYGTDMTFTTNPANAPTVTTANVTNIAALSASGGGNVSDEGGAAVTARGVCWSTAPTPTTADSLTSNGTGTGAFTGSLTGLSANTTYYVRAYATNIYGTAYGSEISFITNAINTPTVTTTNVTNITATSARSGGNITANGGSAVTVRGVCWSTAPNPTVANNRTTNGSGTGVFTGYLTNLTADTTYYVRAYATNAAGTAYGGELQFTTSSEAVKVIITAPGDGDVVSGTVTIAASAYMGSAAISPVGEIMPLTIDKVEFYIDNIQIGQDTSEPYETQWDTTAYAPGSHTIKAVAYANNNDSGKDTITVSVSGEKAEIFVNRDRLNFGSVPVNSTNKIVPPSGSGHLTTSTQALLIDNSGGGTLNWSISTDAGWLSCTPLSGSGAGEVNVSVDPAMSTGDYTASITIKDSSAANSPLTIPVSLRIYDSGDTLPPFGAFQTPLSGSTVSSAVPVTGWVVDDIDVTGVQVYRSPAAGESSSLIYIGDAVLVDGARPDVEQAHPGYPKNYMAGWGYILQTNFLPNQGNGSFTLYAKATDKEGNSVTLGSKSIFCDNANAVKPFGSIDTPQQGGTASGSDFINWGWVLTPQPNTIPYDGSTIKVWIDGVPGGHPVYNIYRADIAEMFPGYNNSDGAVGYFYIDTGNYSNGMHTIAWTAKDNAGNSDGIGSRYFTIINTGSSKSQSKTALTGSASGYPVTKNMEPVWVKKGCGEDNEAFENFADENGTNRVTIQELGQTEIQFGQNIASVRGYLVVNGKFRPLPVGSTLDNSGVFYWSPGPGFSGSYSLIFFIKDAAGQHYTKSIEINIIPKFRPSADKIELPEIKF